MRCIYIKIPGITITDKSYCTNVRRVFIINPYLLRKKKKKDRKEDITTRPYKKNTNSIKKAAIRCKIFAICVTRHF